jgi:ABC-type Zn uptake system ZnuABC Zn-binding protein ZnuA
VARPGILVPLAVLAALLVACGTAEPDPGGTGSPTAPPTEEPAASDAGPDAPAEAVTAPALRLVATVAPITDLVAQVGGDRVEVSSLVPPGADSHTYEPRPSDVVVLGEADAYLGVGLALNDAALALAEQHLPEGAEVLRLGELALDDADLVLDHAHGEDGHTHGEDGHTHGEDGHTHGDDGHTHGDDGHTHDGELGPNPHVWTSVRNAVRLVDTIAAELARLDPEGAATYAANAEAYVDELEALDAAIAQAAATVPDGRRTLVVYHDAWTYFARDHGFELVTAVQPGDFSEPSAAEVRAVIDLIREHDVPAVFGSEVFPSRVLDAIAQETDAVYVGDLADDVLPGDPGDPEHTYVELMRRNAATIVEALGGDPSALAR